MKSILVISNEMEALQTIELCFTGVAQVERALETEGVLEMLRTKRFDLLFIDVRFLMASGAISEIRAALQSLWQIYPTLEIIVMAVPDMIREAVKAVKAGGRCHPGLKDARKSESGTESFKARSEKLSPQAEEEVSASERKRLRLRGP